MSPCLSGDILGYTVTGYLRPRNLFCVGDYTQRLKRLQLSFIVRLSCVSMTLNYLSQPLLVWSQYPSAENLGHYKKSGFSVTLNRFFDYSSILYTMSKKAKKSVSKKEIHFNSIDAYFIVNNIIK